jgi:hypothetical protein
MMYKGNDIIYWAIRWRDIAGPNVYPTRGPNVYPTKGNRPNLETYKDLLGKPIDQILFDFWIKKGLFKGIAIENGRCWHNNYRKHLFIHTLDCDNLAAINLVLNIFGVQSLEELSRRGVIVEQHKGDLTRAHIIFFTDGEFDNLPAKTDKDESFPKLEIKGPSKLTTVSPTMAYDGIPREFVGDSLSSF